ncbi:MAG: acyltransferase family protein, partial [Janthinobacterium lividum]
MALAPPPQPAAPAHARTAPPPAAATIGGARRILGLDVVRACAIALVMASHFSDVFAAFWARHPPAFVSLAGVFGVELFFVLSGFLIGTLLVRAAATAPGWPGWRAFMLRRWLRTLPLYAAWIALMAVFWPPADGRLGWHLLRYLTLTQNLAWPMPADNWFGVSWSLAIE